MTHGIWDIDVFLSCPLFEILCTWISKTRNNSKYFIWGEGWCLFFFPKQIKQITPNENIVNFFFYSSELTFIHLPNILNMAFLKSFKTHWWNTIHTAEFFCSDFAASNLRNIGIFIPNPLLTNSSGPVYSFYYA